MSDYKYVIIRPGNRTFMKPDGQFSSTYDDARYFDTYDEAMPFLAEGLSIATMLVSMNAEGEVVSAEPWGWDWGEYEATIDSRSQVAKDLRALIDYCSDSKEYYDFRDWLLQDGSEFITDEDQEILEDQRHPNRWGPVLEKIAKNPDVMHIWAVAYRVSDVLGVYV